MLEATIELSPHPCGYEGPLRAKLGRLIATSYFKSNRDNGRSPSSYLDKNNLEPRVGAVPNSVVGSALHTEKLGA